MQKTICDICGKEMPSSLFAGTILDYNFAISQNGKCWDICDKCRAALNRFIEERKAESEAADDKSDSSI